MGQKKNCAPFWQSLPFKSIIFYLFIWLNFTQLYKLKWSHCLLLFSAGFYFFTSMFYSIYLSSLTVYHLLTSWIIIRIPYRNLKSVKICLVVRTIYHCHWKENYSNWYDVCPQTEFFENTFVLQSYFFRVCLSCVCAVVRLKMSVLHKIHHIDLLIFVYITYNDL